MKTRQDASTEPRAEHLSSDLLWTLVKSSRRLDQTYVQHTNVCRDCCEFVGDFSRDARALGFSFPDLLPIVEQKC